MDGEDKRKADSDRRVEQRRTAKRLGQVEERRSAERRKGERRTPE